MLAPDRTESLGSLDGEMVVLPALPSVPSWFGEQGCRSATPPGCVKAKGFSDWGTHFSCAGRAQDLARGRGRASKAEALNLLIFSRWIPSLKVTQVKVPGEKRFSIPNMGEPLRHPGRPSFLKPLFTYRRWRLNKHNARYPL